MDYTTLGATGLNVSVAALGCGGHSRLGQSLGMSANHSASIVRQALDAGINFIDTAEAYKTEPIVGAAIAESGIAREKIVISTKFSPFDKGPVPRSVRTAVENSLRALNTDYIDILHAHGIRPEHYELVKQYHVDEMLQLQSEGKIRHLGITEFFIGDSGHQMLQKALADDIWQVMMVGFNLLNFSANERVFKVARQKNIATMIMFAVRRALSRPEALVELIGELIDQGKINPESVNPTDPLDFLRDHPDVKSIPQAAYRFCRHYANADVIQTGTSNSEHLAENIESICAGPLPDECIAKIEEIFSRVDCVSGN